MFQRLMRWWLNRHYPMDKLMDAANAAHSATPPNGQWPIPGPNFDPMAHVNWQHLHDVHGHVPHPGEHGADAGMDCEVTHGHDHHDPVVVCDVHVHDSGPVDTGPPPSPPND